MCLINKCRDYNFNLKLKSNLKKISTLRHYNTFKLFVIFQKSQCKRYEYQSVKKYKSKNQN